MIVTFGVNDGVDTAYMNVSFTIRDVNRNPSLSAYSPSINQTFTVFQNITFSMTVSEPDSDPVNVSLFNSTNGLECSQIGINGQTLTCTIVATNNLVTAGITQRAGYPIRFKDFIKVGFPAALLTLAVGTIYILIRF